MLDRKNVRGIVLKSATELELMRRAGRIASKLLGELADAVAPGVTTQDLDDLHMERCRFYGVQPVLLGYKGYPRSICTSVDQVICHGIPSRTEVLQNGQSICIDLSISLDGYYADNAATVAVGDVSARQARLMHATLESLRLGLDEVRDGARLGCVGAAIDEYAKEMGYSSVRDFVGHGIGRRLHELPQVCHFGRRKTGHRLVTGMTFTVEPMINEGSHHARILDDGWTALTLDGKLSAQYEHTIAVTKTGYEVLTCQNDRGLWEPPGRVMLPPHP